MKSPVGTAKTGKTAKTGENVERARSVAWILRNHQSEQEKLAKRRKSANTCKSGKTENTWNV